MGLQKSKTGGSDGDLARDVPAAEARSALGELDAARPRRRLHVPAEAVGPQHEVVEPARPDGLKE